jgi:hypothetical protein
MLLAESHRLERQSNRGIALWMPATSVVSGYASFLKLGAKTTLWLLRIRKWCRDWTDKTSRWTTKLIDPLSLLRGEWLP